MQAQAAEPTVGQVEAGVLAEPAPGPDAVEVADQQHAKHQFGINRGAAPAAVRRREQRAHEGQVEHGVDAPEQVVGRDMLIEPESVEQRSLRHLLTHHRPHSPPPHGRESRPQPDGKDEFFNSLGPFREQV